MQTDVNDDNENLSAWDELTSREGNENENGGRNPKMERTQTLTMFERKSKVYNVVPIYTKLG